MAALNEETAAAMVASLIVAAVPTDGIAFPKPALPQEPQTARAGDTQIRPLILNNSTEPLVHKPRNQEARTRKPEHQDNAKARS